MSGRHVAPTRRHTGKIAAAIVGAAAIVAVTTGSTAPTSTSAAFTDSARAQTATTAYVVPSPVVAEAQVSGTGQDIYTRLRVTCDAPSGVQWRWRDHMAVWTWWNGWSEWTSYTDEAGWTGWSVSHLTIAFEVAEVQWDVRCGASTWTGTTQLAGPLGIVRTT